MSRRAKSAHRTSQSRLRRAVARAATRAGMRVMLVGFGVGYSWGATLLEWI